MAIGACEHKEIAAYASTNGEKDESIDIDVENVESDAIAELVYAIRPAGGPLETLGDNLFKDRN